jgi:hypothetical protein
VRGKGGVETGHDNDSRERGRNGESTSHVVPMIL